MKCPQIHLYVIDVHQAVDCRYGYKFGHVDLCCVCSVSGGNFGGLMHSPFLEQQALPGLAECMERILDILVSRWRYNHIIQNTCI